MKTTLNSLIETIEQQVSAENPDALYNALDLLDQYPHEAKVWSLLAYIKMRVGNSEEAAKDLTRAIELAPSEPVLFFDRGRCYIKLGEYLSAINDFDCGLSLCSSQSNNYYSESFYFLRAYSYLKLGDKNKALDDLSVVRDGFMLWIDSLCTKQTLLSEINGNAK